MGHDGGKVLVAATRERDGDAYAPVSPRGFAGGDVAEPREGVRGFERDQDAFRTRHRPHGAERVFVGGGKVNGATGVLEVRVLGTDAGIIESRADRVRL